MNSRVSLIILLTLFWFGAWYLWVMTIQIFGDIFMFESSPWKKWVSQCCQQSLFVFVGTFTKHSSKTFWLSWSKISPDVFCCSSVFCLERCQAFPMLSQDTLSKTTPYAIPCSYYSLTWTAAHLGDTNTPTQHCRRSYYHLQPDRECWSFSCNVTEREYRCWWREKDGNYFWFELLLTLLKASHQLSMVCIFAFSLP